MSRELWINLPIKDVKRSREFFAAIGFTIHARHANSDDAVGVVVGDKNTMVMLFPEATFRNFTGNAVADTSQATEVLLSVGAASREEVDEIAAKVEQAGGALYQPPGGQGPMYGCGFADPDGHRWNLLYMEMAEGESQ